MQKFLVVRKNPESEYHIFTAEGTPKECTGSTLSICKNITKEETLEGEKLVTCMGKPSTMVSISKAEGKICKNCLNLF